MRTDMGKSLALHLNKNAMVQVKRHAELAERVLREQAKAASLTDVDHATNCEVEADKFRDLIDAIQNLEEDMG